MLLLDWNCNPFCSHHKSSLRVRAASRLGLANRPACSINLGGDPTLNRTGERLARQQTVGQAIWGWLSASSLSAVCGSSIRLATVVVVEVFAGNDDVDV